MKFGLYSLEKILLSEHDSVLEALKDAIEATEESGGIPHLVDVIPENKGE